ncbi:transcription regulator gal80 [Xanthoria calcicola]
MVIRLGIIGLSADPQAWATMAYVAPLKGALASHYKITAVATSSPETAKASAKAHGLPEEKAYSNPNDIANDPDIDMVVISVKAPMHKQLTIPALKAKKDVFVEWPLGSSLQEAQEMAELAKKQGVRNYVMLQARTQPVFVKAKEMVQSGVLGRITSTTVLGSDSQLMNLPEKARYVNDPASGVSMISILVAHTLDVILYVLCSELGSLTAQAAITHPTIRFLSPTGALSDPEPKRHADNITVSGLLTPGDAVLNYQYLITTPATPSMFQWIISGEKGALKMEGTTFAVQAKPPKLFFAKPPEDDGAKGTDGNKGGGAAEWKELDVPASKLGGVGGVADVFQGIAEGKGIDDGIVDFAEGVKRRKMVDAITKSATDGTRESYL